MAAPRGRTHVSTRPFCSCSGRFCLHSRGRPHTSGVSALSFPTTMLMLLGDGVRWCPLSLVDIIPGLSMGKKRRNRRHWDDDEKRAIVAQTRVPGVSVSRVARRYDVNVNLVLKWIRDPRFRPADDDASLFLPVEVLPEPAVPGIRPMVPDGRIEITLTNGHRLSITGTFDPEAVSRLVRGLSR